MSLLEELKNEKYQLQERLREVKFRISNIENNPEPLSESHIQIIEQFRREVKSLTSLEFQKSYEEYGITFNIKCYVDDENIDNLNLEIENCPAILQKIIESNNYIYRWEVFELCNNREMPESLQEIKNRQEEIDLIKLRFESQFPNLDWVEYIIEHII